MLGPRDGYLSWDDTWMSVAVLISNRSKDNHTQVGAVIVDDANHIVGLGYNGFPKGCDNNALPWDKVGPPLDTKYLFVAHAESNSIDNSDRNRIAGSRIYTTLYPCNSCAIRIIQNGIKEVIYLSDKYHDTDSARASRKMFGLAGVKTRKLESKLQSVVVSLIPPDTT